MLWHPVSSPWWQYELILRVECYRGVVQDSVRSVQDRLLFFCNFHGRLWIVCEQDCGELWSVVLFQTFCGSPKRTILLDDIKDMSDEEDLQDYLEIHFQKPSNCGGEIESIKYLSEGKNALAVFYEEMEKDDEWHEEAHVIPVLGGHLHCEHPPTSVRNWLFCSQMIWFNSLISVLTSCYTLIKRYESSVLCCYSLRLSEIAKHG